MIRSSRLLMSGLTILAVFLVMTLIHLPLQHLAEPTVTPQLEKQTDSTNVQFSVGPYSRFQLANMRYHGLDSSKVATMLELRSNPQLVPHLLHMMSVLDDDWPFRIYHSIENAFLFEARLFKKHIESGKLTLIPLNLDLSNHRAVSNFLAHRALWDNLAPATNVLVYQPDSIICSRSEARVEDFFEYDYVGAPVHERFHEDPNDLFMNGGFSLRKRESMLRVIESFPPFGDEANDAFDYEDQFFVGRLRELGGTLPDRDTAMKFSVETVYYETPLAVHQAERYFDSPHEAEMLRSLKEDWCPEMHLLYGRVGPTAFFCDRSSEHFDPALCAEAEGTVVESDPPAADESGDRNEQDSPVADEPVTATDNQASSETPIVTND